VRRGDISFDEFLQVMSRKVNAKYSPAEVKAAFKVFEGSAPPGHIRVADLLAAITTYCTDKLTAEQAQELIAQLEPDSNGLIAYAAYTDVMMSDKLSGSPRR
jgi:calmodulin